jgi:putative Mn2+ efflux pump MntP
VRGKNESSKCVNYTLSSHLSYALIYTIYILIEVLILAVALSMDAFAVSLPIGAKHAERRRYLGLMVGLYFGVFHALMPLIGYLGGVSIFAWVEDFAPWVAFILLVLIGAKMIYESRKSQLKEDIPVIGHSVMLILAFASSIDAMAVGFSLTLFEVNPYISCLIIGLITSAFSGLGVSLGRKTGTYLHKKAELFGGIILILIGFQILLS